MDAHFFDFAKQNQKNGRPFIILFRRRRRRMSFETVSALKLPPPQQKHPLGPTLSPPLPYICPTHPCYPEKMNQNQFQSILARFRLFAHSERDKGDKFERLMQAYLQTDPRYADLFSNVWLWNDFPARRDFGGKDTGIDLVARTTSGDYWAIQCKCFQENATIDKPAVDSFLATSGRHFKDDFNNFKTTGFAHRLWISTTNHWGTNAVNALQNQQPPVTRLGLHELETAPVDWGKLDGGRSGDASRTAKKSPLEHQKKAIAAAHEHFKTARERFSADLKKMLPAAGGGAEGFLGFLEGRSRPCRAASGVRQLRDSALGGGHRGGGAGCRERAIPGREDALPFEGGQKHDSV
jgi:hypothetical protein